MENINLNCNRLLWLSILCFICREIPIVYSCGFQYLGLENIKTAIQTPNYPGPPPFVKNCFYEIAFPRNTFNVYYMEIVWEEFDLVGQMPNCDGNFVEVQIGGASMGRFCGKDKPHAIYSLGDTVTLRLTADGVSSSMGFKISYVLRNRFNSTVIGDRKDEACSSQNIPAGGLLLSEPWPMASWESLTCSYTIAPPTGFATRISIMNANMAQRLEGMPCENKLFIRGRIGTTVTTLYSSDCEDIRGEIVDSKSEEIYITIQSDQRPISYTGFMIGFTIFEDIGQIIEPTMTSPTGSPSTSGIAIGLGVAVLLCVVILLFILWKRRRALEASSGVPCNPNRRIPQSNTGYVNNEQPVEVITHRVPPSYVERPVDMNEPPPPYTVDDAARTNPGF